MYTFQDLEKIGDDDEKRMQFVYACITEFKNSPAYKFGTDAKVYYEGENPNIARAQKVVYDMLGQAHADTISPNHKIYSRYVFSAVTEETQYLLSNGVSFDNDGTKQSLGADFDTVLQELADDAQVYGCGWGYWDGKKLNKLPFLQVKPLPDEYDGSVKAVIRFWQIADDKPLIAVLYEVDGFTEYIQEPGEKMRVRKKKTRYPKTIRETAFESEIEEFQNYPALPIIPLYFINKKSILHGNTPAVDAYDLLNSRMVSNIDEGNLVYWVLKNCNAMDENDDAAFIANLIKSRVMHVDGDEGAEATPHQIEAPVQSTETGIQRIKRLLDDNFMTCDVDAIRAGNVTATQIRAAYQKLDAKTSKFEYCVIEFIQRLLFVVTGKDGAEKFTFKWDKTINKTEEITTIIQAAQFLDEETVTQMILEAFGKIDILEDVMQRRESAEMQRFSLDTSTANQNAEQPQKAAESVEEAAEEITGKGLNGIQAQALITILGQLSSGAITAKQAVSIIAITVGISKEKAKEIVNGVD